MLETGFTFITLLSVLLFYLGTGKDKRVLVISLLWLLFTGGIASTGFFRNTVAIPPRFSLVVIGGVSLVVYALRIIKTVRINAHILILIHSIRIPVEIALYQLFLKGEVPEIMTFTAWNYDILMGISALIIFLYIQILQKKLSHRFLLIWNVIGILFLTVIVFIALLSAPLPFQQLAFDQPNIAVQRFPFIFLPAYIVPIVYASHFLSIKRLKKTNASPTVLH